MDIRRQRSLDRGVAAFAVLVLLVAQLGALIHNANVRHVRCAEHGELVEATEATDKLDPNARTPEGVRFVGVNGSSETHAHCAIADGLCPHSAPTTLQVAATAGAFNATEQPHADRQSASKTALYRTAPKTSPPGAWVTSST